MLSWLIMIFIIIPIGIIMVGGLLSMGGFATFIGIFLIASVIVTVAFWIKDRFS